MGIYLDSKKSSALYGSEKAQPYFIDKTSMLEELALLVESGNNYVCITRPRRFGKTVIANMIAAYYGKGRDTGYLFDDLKISHSESYQKHLNMHHTILISLNEVPRKCTTYAQYIDRVEMRLKKDLNESYPDCENNEDVPVWDMLGEIYEREDIKFIFILDEWDYIFHQDFVSEQDKKWYVRFLSNLFKDKPYVSMAYLTGILPIAKYSSGSELNMFLEYTMATKEKYSKYFGFCDAEVDELYKRYLEIEKSPNIGREELRQWYDGYQTLAGSRMYNPRSVVSALKDNQISNYWTN